MKTTEDEKALELIKLILGVIAEATKSDIAPTVLLCRIKALTDQYNYPKK